MPSSLCVNSKPHCRQLWNCQHYCSAKYHRYTCPRMDNVKNTPKGFVFVVLSYHLKRVSGRFFQAEHVFRYLGYRITQIRSTLISYSNLVKTPTYAKKITGKDTEYEHLSIQGFHNLNGNPSFTYKKKSLGLLIFLIFMYQSLRHLKRKVFITKPTYSILFSDFCPFLRLTLLHALILNRGYQFIIMFQLKKHI